MTANTPKTPQELLQTLQQMGLAATTITHAAVKTVEENQALRGTVDGEHSKNLFLKDKKKQLWLVVAEEERPIDLKILRKRIGAGNLSFGKPDLLLEKLGVLPGSVTPFAVINDVQGDVQVVLDQDLAQAPLVNFHPLTNTQTTTLSGADLVTFLQKQGHEPMILDFEAPLESE